MTGSAPPGQDRPTVLPLSDIEVARMWRSLGATPAPLPQRNRVHRTLILGIGLAGLGAAVAFVVVWALSSFASTGPDSVALPGTSAPAAASALFDREFQLADGTRIALGADAHIVEIKNELQPKIRLLKGTAVVNTPDKPTSSFILLAGKLSIKSHGARLRVTLVGEDEGGAADPQVDVSVLGGRAELRFDGSPASGRPPLVLEAGQAFTTAN